MTRKTLSPIGGLQPFLFCIGMYFVALFFSIFICSSVFYAINPKKDTNRQTMAGLRPMLHDKHVYASVK